MRRPLDAGDVEQGGREVDVEDGLGQLRSRVEAGAPNEERHLDVELRRVEQASEYNAAPSKPPDFTNLERQALSLDDAELAEVVAVVGGVDDVRVVQLAHLSQLAV